MKYWLAIDAARTLLIDREELIARADEGSIAVIAMLAEKGE